MPEPTAPAVRCLAPAGLWAVTAYFNPHRYCSRRANYLRFRLNINDVFDQLEKFMKPLRPRVFNLISPRDLRKAIAEIVAAPPGQATTRKSDSAASCFKSATKR